MPGSIIINPSVFTDKRDAFAVAVNEALRLWMEDYEFTPEFDITPEQEAFFKDTAYAGDMVAMSKTILARIATRDTSIPRPTPEQIAETSRLLDGVMDTAGLSMADFMLASQMQEALFYDHSPTSEEEEMPDAPEGTGSTTSAMGGGDVRTGYLTKGIVHAKPGEPLDMAVDRAKRTLGNDLIDNQKIVDDNTGFFDKKKVLGLELKIIGNREDRYRDGQLVGYDYPSTNVVFDSHSEKAKDMEFEAKVAKVQSDIKAVGTEIKDRITQLPGVAADVGGIIKAGANDYIHLDDLAVKAELAIANSGSKESYARGGYTGEVAEQLGLDPSGGIRSVDRATEEGRTESVGLNALGIPVTYEQAVQWDKEGRE